MKTSIVLLSEDQQTDIFVKKLLKISGFKMGCIRSRIAPKGKGSGEQWVREQYRNELVERRKQRTALVIVTDADIKSVKQRIDSLDNTCGDVVDPRTPDEPVAMIIPKRNIETWFAYLRGESVDEEKEYPRYAKPDKCFDDAQKLKDMCDKGFLRQPAPPSLEAACLEYKKLKKFRNLK